MCDGHSRKRRATKEEEQPWWIEEPRRDALGRRTPKESRQTEELADFLRAEQGASFENVASAQVYLSTASYGVFVAGPLGAAGP